jgi:hypothetical protein
MPMTVIDSIPFSPDTDETAERLGLGGMLCHDKEVKERVGLAAQIGAPRACFTTCDVQRKDEATVVIAGQRFQSRILRVNLAHSDRAVLFVATCGTELEKWAESYQDMLLRWVAEDLCEQALRAAVAALDQAVDPLLEGRYKVSMNPGSLEDWPLQQQKLLFRALGTVTQAIGVELTESSMMRPRKSISGIKFSSHQPFANCRLCPRRDCPGRRMPFDSHAFEQEYAGARHGGLYEETCSLGHDLSQ